ncbi:MAG TPA: type II toxin-antitoxin system VapC family toxin [Longimicrobium sp.]|nr:type II toxin-antitoxin system VapC family toxin [Longimicrobium sp.]
MPPRETLYYLDTSALAKLYLDEPGSRRLASWVGKRVRGFTPEVRIFVSRIVFAEAMSAIARRRNENHLSAEAAVRLWGEVIADFTRPRPPYEILEVTEAVVYQAALLVARYRLRAYDAVHLATAMRLQLLLKDSFEVVFVCSDRRLTLAAEDERLRVVDPVTRRRRPRARSS